MSDTPKAYKLNKEKQKVAEDGKFLYYFYDRHKLTAVALPEEKFDKLVAMDSEFYNLERRENAHKMTFKKSANTNSYKKIDIEKDDFGQSSADDEEENAIPGADFTDKIDKQCDIERKVSSLSPDDGNIYNLYYVQGYRQTEIAEELGKTQGYVAKRLMKIDDALRDNKTDEARANAQWEKFLQKFRTDDDEDILWNMFLYLMPVEEQVDIASWFYSYREFYKFGLSYLVIRPFDKVTDQTEFGNRMNELPYHSRYMYYEIFDGQPEELQWLYLALCEETERRKKTFTQRPAGTNFDKIFQKAEEICKRLEMTSEEFVSERFIPKEAEKRGKRYKDYRRKYQNIVVVDEADSRSIEEQLRDIFGDGPTPEFLSPEFRKKK